LIRKKPPIILLTVVLSGCTWTGLHPVREHSDMTNAPQRRECHSKSECKRLLDKLITQTWRNSKYYQRDVTVKARVLLNYKNEILEVNLLQSSGDPAIDTATEDLLKKLTPFNELKGLSIEDYGEMRELFFIFD